VYIIIHEKSVQHDSIDILPNTIYEVIVTTYDKNGKANAAPMGITFDEEKNVIIRPFLETTTYENLCENKECVVATLFKEELSSKNFIKTPDINAPILLAKEKNCIAIKIIEKGKESGRAIFTGKIIQTQLNLVLIKPITRAFSSLLEILIHATRVIHYKKSEGENSSTVKELMLLIDHHVDIIKRVTSDKLYNDLVEKILTTEQKKEAFEGYFLTTKENLIFDVKGIAHPSDRIIAFVRYVPIEFGLEDKPKRKTHSKLYALADRRVITSSY